MPDEAALQERQRQLDEREQLLATREAQVAQQKAQEHRNEVTEFAEALVQAGRLLPRQKAPVIELLVSLPTDTPLEFAEGDGQVASRRPRCCAACWPNCPSRWTFPRNPATAAT